jgi:hypothetical protein
VAGFKGAEVYTFEGKKIGTVRKVDSSYFTAYRSGLVADEEFRVPLSAISAVENEGNYTIIRLSISEEQIKHGFEFLSGKPNSEFASGAAESEPKIPMGKQVIHYESQPANEGEAVVRPPRASEYHCDMCDARFDDSSELQEHRVEHHKAPTGI